MDYEQKYKEILEIARKAFYSQETPHVAKAWLLTMFPTIAENEDKDERMKKAIIHVLYENYTDAAVIEGVEIAEIIAWLEKQGKKKSMWTDNDRTMAFTLLRDVDKMTYISSEGKNARLQWLNSLEEKFNKSLDHDKVIEWLECKAFQGWAEPIDIRPIIRKFKKDFGI